MADPVREAFEAWYAGRHPDPVDPNPTWAHAHKVDDLEVWQAAYQAGRAELAKDAERYRWLRDKATQAEQDAWLVRLPEQADAYADARVDAMVKEGS